MKDLSQITCCVIDHGLGLPLAQRLAKAYKRVLYHTPWERGHPTINECVIGDGFENLERCDDFWKVKSEIDLFVFPDIHHGGLQVELASQGFPVWGSRHGSRLEVDREYFHRVLDKLGLKSAQFAVVEGINALRRHLVDEEDKYIKISKYRGSMETWHWRTWREDEGVLDALAVKFGPAKELVRFLVFDAIDTDLEIGGDTFNVRGKFPQRMIHGLEWKDKGFLASVLRTEEMPEPIQEVNAAFAPLLEKAGYTNFWSTEIRVKGEEFYFGDPTCRIPCPATASQLALYRNVPEIIWAGANGDLVEPDIDDSVAVECVLSTKADNGNWKTVDLPEELREFVAFSECCEIDGRTCFPPDDPNVEEVGWIWATGRKIDETIRLLQERIALLPDGVKANTDSLYELLKEAHSAEEETLP